MTRRQRYQPTAVTLGAMAVATLFIAGSPSALDTSRIMGIYALIALSLGISWGQGGMLSLAVASFASVGAYTTAILTVNYGLPLLVGLVMAVAVPWALTYLVARIVVRLSELSLAVATLVLATIIEFVISSGGSLTGGFIGISGIPLLPYASNRLAVHFTVWGSVAAVVWLYSTLRFSTQGRAARLIAHDRKLAASMGIPVASRLSAVFALSGAVAGVAGWLYAHTSSYLAPASLSAILSLTVVIMVVVGGRRTILGPVVGAVGVTALLDVVPSAAVEGMFYGTAVVLAIVFFPDGVLGSKWMASAWSGIGGKRRRRNLSPRTVVGTDAKPSLRQGERP